MENLLPDNTDLILGYFGRLTKEVIKSDANVKLSIGTITENICVEFLHYSDYYEYGNKTLTFYHFSSEEKLARQESIAIDVLQNNGVIKEEDQL